MRQQLELVTGMEIDQRLRREPGFAQAHPVVIDEHPFNKALQQMVVLEPPGFLDRHQWITLHQSGGKETPALAVLYMARVVIDTHPLHATAGGFLHQDETAQMRQPRQGSVRPVVQRGGMLALAPDFFQPQLVVALDQMHGRTGCAQSGPHFRTLRLQIKGLRQHVVAIPGALVTTVVSDMLAHQTGTDAYGNAVFHGWLLPESSPTGRLASLIHHDPESVNGLWTGGNSFAMDGRIVSTIMTWNYKTIAFQHGKSRGIQRRRAMPFSREQASHNKQKALLALHGLCSGVIADQQLNQHELLYLRSWLDNQQYLRKDPDAVDILDIVEDILSDGVAERQELEDLLSQLETVRDYRSLQTELDHQQINQLLGILEGISADEYLNDREILYLRDWINDHPNIRHAWPASELTRHIDQILADGRIDAEERDWLLETVKLICGNDFMETGLAGGATIAAYFDSAPEINPQNASVCFTGNFLCGPRSFLLRSAENIGSIPKTNVSKKVDYLIVGSIIAPDWMFTSHGRKVQHALELKQEGHPIIIAPEHAWTPLIVG